MDDRRRGCPGFSFIEVIVALGLLAIVLISISALFISGQRQVKAGRTTSVALASARTIVEELETWGFRQTYLQFGLDGTATAYTVDTLSNAYAEKWQPALDEHLAGARAEISIASIETGGTTPVLASASAVSLIVTVIWSEHERQRQVRLGTVKL